ncbi:hypothetical protein BO70DRAFT_333453 [Aspergillus heteromorphus CBS 117.55]|uniref:Uncharacterized protein n=1 Tax=Aspergillus heteromorphus CBS 117.55 TaxID=1448321 RepID=A0A317WMD4_9EURO|nr:uncharacterized protein BO70DRAFT_333453 [Aspergillus heteromorphus CBS 117.55]PWY86871.1 hypothetical protein BO70DRAFT_333453 [Aspergillus heteromorphus CBS 117.55]
MPLHHLLPTCFLPLAAPLLLLLFATLAAANVEKTIFLGPPPSTIPTPHPPIDDLGLARLSPSQPILRTSLNASFPTPDTLGTDSWYFLENLTPGRRYEVRICWLATQPTTFILTTHTLPHALSDPILLTSITKYSSTRLITATPDLDNAHISGPSDSAPVADSVLFLRIRATADYFSTDAGLMANVPPVAADIILDPFLGNVFPRSLVPTACYVVVVGGVAALVGGWVVRELGRVVDVMAEQGEKEGEREQLQKKVN